MSPTLIAALTAGSFLIALAVTRWLVGALLRRGVMDRPNARSSHTIPTPRGGGLGILAGTLPAWGYVVDLGGPLQGTWPLLAGIGALAVVSWLDDRSGLPWSWRLAVQLMAVAVTIVPLLGLIAATLQTILPLAYLVAALAAFAWLGFVNAFNFMDGIDGIAGTETVFVALGCALAFGWLGSSPWHDAGLLVVMCLTLAAAAAGFLAWNRPPARIFMGDVGSIPVGFMLGFLLVTLAASGAWGAALTLPAYFGADATLTLLRRWRRGARLTEPHREHAYQRAAGREKAGHARVLWRVAVANLALVGAVAIGLAVGGHLGQTVTVALGAVIVGALLYELERLAAQPATA
jgi:UDP-N-acetylmuramyl pentapeptide phosphotransferase/UDP-N-acetylglucosamine-1-phosphate transferase